MLAWSRISLATDFLGYVASWGEEEDPYREEEEVVAVPFDLVGEAVAVVVAVPSDLVGEAEAEAAVVVVVTALL